MFRREFVRMCGLTVVSLGLGAAGMASAAVGGRRYGGARRRRRIARQARQSQEPEPGSRASFESQVGDWFYVDAERRHQLQLGSVEPGPDAEGLEQFSLYFSGASDVEIDEGLYSVQSDRGEIDEIFLQPVGDDAEGRIFKAPFARLQPAS